MNSIISILILLLSTVSPGQEAYPPPPKEEPVEKPQPTQQYQQQRRKKSQPPTPRQPAVAPLFAPENLNNTQKYEYCFNRMIDLEKAANNFMRSCLGLAPRATQPQKSATGEYEFLDAKIIKSVFQQSDVEFKLCFTDYALEERKRGIVANGLFEPVITIQPSGAVSGARLSKKSLTARSLEGCLKKSLFKLKFPKYSSKKVLSAFISYKMNSPGGQIELSLSRKPIRLRGVPGFTETEKMAVYRAGLPKIRTCYDNLLKTKPDATGRTGVKLRVSALGKVVDVQILENTVYDATFNSCIIKTVKTYKFPTPRTNSLTNVHYPFIFAHKVEDIK